MHHPRVSGTYREMGFKYGSLLRKHDFKLPTLDDETRMLGLQCEPEVGRVFPEILDEIRGLANGLKQGYESVAAFLLTVGYGQPKACSAFASVVDSKVVFGRNYDFYFRLAKYAESYLTRPNTGYASLGNSDIFLGREDGVNEKGLAVSMHFVAANLGVPGVNFPIAVRYVLDKCATVEEAIGFLTNIKFLTANNYLVADKNGEMVVVEACPSRVQVRHPGNDEKFMVATNHFLHPEMKQFEDEAKKDPDSELRYSTIMSSLREVKGRVTEAVAKRILANHQGRVCSHLDYIQLGTLWSQITELNSLSVLRAEGQPCKTKYKPDKRLHSLVEA